MPAAPDDEGGDPVAQGGEEGAGGEQDEPEAPVLWGTDKDGIVGAVRAIVPQIKECYEGWLKAGNEDDRVEGKMVLAFTIESVEGEGRAGVNKVAVRRDDLEVPFLTGCFINLAESMRFEDLDEPMNVTYPFHLAPAP